MRALPPFVSCIQDRVGNTPLHLAIESGHAEAAVALIEGGADRDRGDSEGVRPEEIEGVGGVEAKRVREYSQSFLLVRALSLRFITADTLAG